MDEYTKELIDALRCSASPPSERRNPDCENCEFSCLELLSEDDAKLVGKSEWVSCDVDRISFEAAAMLEELSHG